MLSDYVPCGKENAVSKGYLSKMTGLDERMVRQGLKDANKVLIDDGVAIVSTASHKGYWKTDNLDELKAYEAEQMHRAVSIILNLDPVRELIKRIESQNQIEMGD